MGFRVELFEIEDELELRVHVAWYVGVAGAVAVAVIGRLVLAEEHALADGEEVVAGAARLDERTRL